LDLHTSSIPVYLETGAKRVFAGGVDWPGWCRSGRDEASALQALADYAPRFTQVLATQDIPFHAKVDVSTLSVVERLVGTATTDFGAPDIPTSSDAQPLEPNDLEHCERLLRACWISFDRGVKAAEGKELRKGPRGGGRELEKIVQHVMGVDAAYLRRLAWKVKIDEDTDLSAGLELTRQGALDALAAASRGELPERGPRGGTLWSPRYYIRRVAWHVLDHLWEIEDRST
jgi:hypothetical protein